MVVNCRLFSIALLEIHHAKEIHAINRLTPFLSYLGVVEYNKKLPLDFLWDIDSFKISEAPKKLYFAFPRE